MSSLTDARPSGRSVARVFVRGLAIEAEVGLHAHERGRRQPLLIDVELHLTGEGPWSRLADTVDYGMIVTHAQAIAASGHITLVETFAERLARACLAEGGVEQVRVRVEKPAALAPLAAGAGVEIILRAD